MTNDLNVGHPDAAITARAREVAEKLSNFASAWYAGESNGKDDFRFIAHAAGDIAAALCAVRDETISACADAVETFFPTGSCDTIADWQTELVAALRQPRRQP